MADEKNYITPGGFRALQAEFEELRGRKRPEVVSRLADAAAEGDRSENAEYIYRKKQLREIDRRIRFLMKRMAIAEVIDPSHHKSDKVCFGALVTVEDEDGKTLKYQVVGVDETDAKAGRISWRSPIGGALVGKAEGEAVSVRWHAGERELVIVRIEFPELSGGTWQPLRQVDLEQALSGQASSDGDGDDDDGAPDEGRAA